MTSRQTAQILSNAFDWLVTVDPHLHRYGSLSEIYRIPTRVVHAAPLISAWIREHVASPLIIVPTARASSGFGRGERCRRALFGVGEEFAMAIEMSKSL